MPSAAVSRLQIVAAAALFSTGGAAIKACSLTGWQVAGFRSGVAALTLLALIPRARRRWTLPTLLVATAYAATLIAFVVANKQTTSANAIFLQSTAPLYLLLLGPWLLAEPVRRADLAFMAAFGLGLWLVFWGLQPASATAPQPFAGNVAALASGLFFALMITGLRWLSRETPPSPGAPARALPGDRPADPAIVAVTAGNLIAFLFCLPLALPVRGSGTADWLVIVFLGSVQIGLAYAFLTAGLRQVRAVGASLLLLVEPVLNPVWSWMLHGERPAARALAGGAVILAATAARTLGDLRPAGRP